MRTRALRDGDDYIIDGQKTWTTQAQYADWGFFLVRTDPDAKIQQGISFVLVDMSTPGVTVRPIITLGGEHEVNEVFLEGVRVPVANRIHGENQGWTCAKFLLLHERTGIANVAASKAAVARLKELAREDNDGQPRLIESPAFRRKLAELDMDIAALEFTELRTLADEAAGRGPGPESSMLKIKGTEIQQRITELALEVAGDYAAVYWRDAEEDGNAGPVAPAWATRAATIYFNMRKTSIYGGSNEIQRNIIAKTVLGL